MKWRAYEMPVGLRAHRRALRRCIEAFSRVRPVRQVYLFGSYARGEAREDSDVDLCIVADGAEHQFEAARQFRRAVREVWPRPSLTLIPITPQRLEQKRKRKDHFFATVLKEGVLLAESD